MGSSELGLLTQLPLPRVASTASIFLGSRFLPCILTLYLPGIRARELRTIVRSTHPCLPIAAGRGQRGGRWYAHTTWPGKGKQRGLWLQGESRKEAVT